MTNNIIRYTIEEIDAIESTIDAVLDQEIIDKLLEIKKNNKFLKKSHPVRLKYSMITQTANKWKENKLNNDLEEDHFKENINLNLNKLSGRLYDNISQKIITSVQEYGLETSKDIILDLIFNKAINEKQYACLYCKLCIQLIKLYGEEFKTNILFESEQFYHTNIKNISETQTHENYDEFCDNNKLKKKVVGIYIFMAYLYTNSIISCEILLKYITSLFETIYSEKEHETNILCLCELITIAGEKLENNLKDSEDTFKTIIIDKLLNIKNDRKMFKPKLRFLVMNVVDLYTNKWQSTT